MDFESSDYEFTATADDGVRLWVDGQLLIDWWRDDRSSGQHEADHKMCHLADATLIVPS